MPFYPIRDDITRMKVDAVVNASNRRLIGWGGVDGAIRCAAGPELEKATKWLGFCGTGEAKITKGYRLPAGHIIHTVGPVYKDGLHGEETLLRSCYRNSLALAEKNGFASIAFPLISAGTFGYPRKEAIRVASEEILAFLEHSDMTVYLVFYDSDSFALGRDRFPDLESRIEESRVTSPVNNRAREYPGRIRREAEAEKGSAEEEVFSGKKEAAEKKDSAEKPVRASSAGFSYRAPLGRSFADAAEKELSRLARRGKYPEVSRIPEEDDYEEMPEFPDLKGSAPDKKETAAGVKRSGKFPKKDREDAPASGMKSSYDLEWPATGGAWEELAPSESVLIPPREAPETSGIRYSQRTIGSEKASAAKAPPTLEDALKKRDESFAQMLFRCIDASGMTDPECYHKANIDKKLFSKIRSKADYKPSKATVLAFAVALEMDREQTALLLKRAGFAFNGADTFDIIVDYFISRKNYSIHEINLVLFDYDQPLLGNCAK